MAGTFWGDAMAKHTESWKVLEREAATKLGGTRNPASGGLGGVDVDTPRFVVECKYRQQLGTDTLYRFEKAKRKAELADGRKFVLVTRAKGQAAMVTLTLDDFAELVGEE